MAIVASFLLSIYRLSMSDAIRLRCVNCFHWDPPPSGETRGTCYRYPATPGEKKNDPDLRPRPSATDGCGEWQKQSPTPVTLGPVE